MPGGRLERNSGLLQPRKIVVEPLERGGEVPLVEVWRRRVAVGRVCQRVFESVVAHALGALDIWFGLVFNVLKERQLRETTHP